MVGLLLGLSVVGASYRLIAKDSKFALNGKFSIPLHREISPSSFDW